MTTKTPIQIRILKTKEIVDIDCDPAHGFQAIVRDHDGRWLMPCEVGEIEVVGANTVKNSIHVYDQRSKNGHPPVFLESPDFCLLGAEAALRAAGYRVVLGTPAVEIVHGEVNYDSQSDRAAREKINVFHITDAESEAEIKRAEEIDNDLLEELEIDRLDNEMACRMRFAKVHEIHKRLPERGVKIVSEYCSVKPAPENTKDADGCRISASPDIRFPVSFDAIEVSFPLGECPTGVARTLRKFADMMDSEAGTSLANLKTTRSGEDEAFRLADGSVLVKLANQKGFKKYPSLQTEDRGIFARYTDHFTDHRLSGTPKPTNTG